MRQLAGETKFPGTWLNDDEWEYEYRPWPLEPRDVVRMAAAMVPRRDARTLNLLIQAYDDRQERCQPRARRSG